MSSSPWHCARCLWLVLICWPLAACSVARDDTTQLLRDYRERVLNLLDVDVAELAVSRPSSSGVGLPTLLRKRELLLPVDIESVGLLEFFELQQCDLGALVGARSNSLGKLAPLSERLIYELQFLHLARRCLTSNESLSDDAKQLVASIVERKLGVLDRHLWNALFAGPEMLRRLGSAEGNLSELATQLTDLRDLSRLARDSQEGWAAWNPALKSLGGGGGIGPAIARWEAIERELSLVVAALQQKGSQACRNGRPTPQVRNLKGTLEEFFVVRVRAKLAADLQRDESWVRSMNALADDFSAVSPPAFVLWRSQTLAGAHSLWQRSQSRLTQHAQAWTALLDGCGLSLAPSPRESL